MNPSALFPDHSSDPCQDDCLSYRRSGCSVRIAWRVGVKTGSVREFCHMMAPAGFLPSPTARSSWCGTASGSVFLAHRAAV